MPTTPEETKKIVDICLRNDISIQQLCSLTRDLHYEVGQKSENDSVKQTMAALYRTSADVWLTKKEEVPDATESRLFNSVPYGREGWYFLLVWLVVFHFLVWICLIASSVACLLYQPLYMAMLTVSFVIYLITVEEMCPLTIWENYLRSKLGWPKVNNFGHVYILCPLLNLEKFCDKHSRRPE